MRINKEITKPYFKVFFPTCISMVMYSLYCFSDVFFVGKGAGSIGLAALNIALPIFTLFSAVGMMFGIGTTIMTSIYKARNNADRANKTFSMYVFMGSVIGISTFIFFTLYTKNIALILGADEMLIETTVSYMRMISPCALFSVFIYSLPIIVRADGSPKLAMVAGLIGNFINIILDYLFVLPMQMGAAGAGLATAIGALINLSILMLHYITKRNSLKLTKNFLKLKYLKRICKNGFSSSILELSTGSVIFLTNIALMAISGAEIVGVFSVISNIAFIAKNLFNATAQASQPLISENYAKNNLELLKESRNLSLIIAILISIITVILLNVFGKQLLILFIGNNESLIKQGVIAIAIYFSLFIFTGINTIVMYYFQSMECSKIATLISCLRGFICPIVLLAILPRIFGIYGVWVMVSLAELSTFLIIYPLAKKAENKIEKKILWRNQNDNRNGVYDSSVCNCTINCKQE